MVGRRLLDIPTASLAKQYTEPDLLIAIHPGD